MIQIPQCYLQEREINLILNLSALPRLFFVALILPKMNFRILLVEVLCLIKGSHIQQIQSLQLDLRILLLMFQLPAQAIIQENIIQQLD